MATPGEVLNIGTADGQNHFNVGIGRPGAHTDYSPTQIAGGYTSDPEFIVTPDGTAVQFRVRMDAAKTSANTKYPRSELREYAENGIDKAAWNGSSGTHYMEGVSRITHLPPNKPWVVFAQIHDASSDLIRVQTEGTSTSALKIVARNTPPGGGSEIVKTVMSSYRLGDPITWRLEVINGAGKLFLNGTQVQTFDGGTSGCYFKAGAYAQSNSTIDSASEYAAVELKNLKCWHTGYPPAAGSGGGGGGGTPPPAADDPTFGGAGALAADAGNVPITPPFPSGLTAGDCLITAIYDRDGSSPATPTDWTQVSTTATEAGGGRLTLYRHFWQAGDVAPSYVSTAGTGGIYGVCSRWGNVHATTPIDAVVAESGSSTTTVTAPSVTTIIANSMVVHFLAHRNDYVHSAPTNGTTLTYGGAAYSSALGADACMSAAHKLVQFAGASGTTSLTATGQTTLPEYAALSIALRQKDITAPPPAAGTPAEVLNIGTGDGQNHFKLEFARAGDPGVTEKTQNELVAGFDEDPYFTLGSGGTTTQFWVAKNAPPPAGSSFPRSVLRELGLSGANHAFNSATGTHYVRGRTKITHLPLTQVCVIAALKGATADQIELVAEPVSGSLKLKCRINGSSAGQPLLIDPYTVGGEFEWKIELVNGTANVYINNMTTPVITSSAVTHSTGSYFVVGVEAE